MKEIGSELKETMKRNSESDEKKAARRADRCKVISIEEARKRNTGSGKQAIPASSFKKSRMDAVEEPALKELELKRTAMRNVIGTVQEREKRAVRQRQRRKAQVYQRKLVICFAALLILVNICGFMMTNAFADEAVSPALHPYYTSIQVEEGDSLWSIASRYSAKSPMDTQEYISELKRMNQLTSDTIHAGHYLTVVYYK